MGVKLTLEGVSKSWPGFQLREIRFDVSDGEYFVLLGPTGAGKTLLLETIMGYLTPDSGRILLDDVDITETAPKDRNIGYVPQTPSLAPDMSVRENMEYSLKRRNLADKWKHAVDGILQVMGLSEIEDRPAIYLSGGEKRKLALARVLILQPDAILLDEPLSSIDERKKRDLQDDLRMIHSYLDITAIHVTHDKLEAYSLGERMGVMISGKVLQVGKPEEIFNRPCNRDVASFLGYENIYEVESVGVWEDYTKIDVGSNTIQIKKKVEDGNLLAAIWNHDVKYSKSFFKGLEENTFEGSVTNILDEGRLVTITGDIGIPIRSTVLRSTYKVTPVKVGEKVWFSFKSDDIKLLPKAKE